MSQYSEIPDINIIFTIWPAPMTPSLLTSAASAYRTLALKLRFVNTVVWLGDAVRSVPLSKDDIVVLLEELFVYYLVVGSANNGCSLHADTEVEVNHFPRFDSRPEITN